jgi:hypothetical protein
MGEETQVGGVAGDARPDVKALRVQIDAAIQACEKLSEVFKGREGGRELALVKTKLQEAKMWGGKVLEAWGSELPPEFRDKAV